MSDPLPRAAIAVDTIGGNVIVADGRRPMDPDPRDPGWDKS